MGAITHQKRYAAFISYAHADEAMAARLHKALETYPVPKHLRAQGKTTKPVFRDVAELTAAHSLSEKIQEAVKDSRVLIVLCSPAAKASHWVNEEIRLFRKLHGDTAILSAIIEGTPETAFPEALTEGGREPLAAALGADKAGFKLGVTQLAAGMLGTGLDDLVRRGAKRRQRIMGAGLAASLALSGVMGFTTLQAVEARKEAESARGDAEGLVEYMIKDLKFKLEPVGRLDLLEGIGDKAVDYYDKQDIKTLPDDSLIRQAAARQVLAQVHLDAGRLEEAQKEIETSAALTREVLARNPDDTDAIFAHAQSEYWVGGYYKQQGKLAEVEKHWREYDRLAQVLYQKDKNNFDWVMEAAWGQNNLGLWTRKHYTKPKTQESIDYYSQAIVYFKEALIIKPDSKLAQYELSNVLAGRASAQLSFGTAKQSRAFKLEELQYLQQLMEQYPDDKRIGSEKLKSELDYYHDYFLTLSEIQEARVKGLLKEFYELTLHDPENLSYKISFLDYSFEYFLKMELPSQMYMGSQFSKLVLELPKDSEDKKYYEIVISFVNRKSKLENDFNLDGISRLQKLKLTYLIFLQQESSSAAKKFLSATKDLSDLEWPTILKKKIRAHAVLNDCAGVSLYSKALHSRGFIETPRIDLKECRVSD